MNNKFYDHWISLTEKTLFNLAFKICQLEDGNKPYTDLVIMRKLSVKLELLMPVNYQLLMRVKLKRNKSLEWAW